MTIPLGKKITLNHHQHDEKSVLQHSFQPSHKLCSKVSLWQGDIAKLEVDAIVNSVHGDEDISHFHLISMCRPRTVADCIYKAGGKSLLAELSEKSDWSNFKPIITGGYQLPAKCEENNYCITIMYYKNQYNFDCNSNEFFSTAVSSHNNFSNMTN